MSTSHEAEFSQVHYDRKPLLCIDGISKQYDNFLALDNLSLSLGEGSVTALLGGPGSGKSTLLRILAGFEVPSEGRLILRGKDISLQQPWQRSINMIFQSYALFPHLSVAKNIAYGLHRDNLPKSKVRQRIDDWVNRLNLSALSSYKPRQLSPKQQLRVALARSLVKHPDLLLLDQPTAALSKEERPREQLEMLEIIRELGVSCLIATQDPQEAMTVADRVAILEGGWLVQEGSPSDTYEHPVSRMAAQCMGAVNIFDGEIDKVTPDHVVIRSANLAPPLWIGHGIDPSIDERQAWVAIRPEKIWVELEKPTKPYNWSEGLLENIAYQGERTLYYIKLPSGMLVQSVMNNIERGVDPFTRGSKIYISWHDHSAKILYQ